MKLKIPSFTPVAVAAAIAAFTIASTSALAATASPSRDDVKAQTLAAGQAGRLVPPGEGVVVSAPQEVSTRTRDERKAETLRARRAGELRTAGQEPEWKAARALARTPPTTTRADRKSSTLAAAREHRLTPAGEGVGPTD